MTKYGYARVSTVKQELESQIQTLQNEGCNEILEEKYTGTTTDRPIFARLLNQLKKGDIFSSY
jgi:DNA invertase Pin-like site-specific DNA recombinase